MSDTTQLATLTIERIVVPPTLEADEKGAFRALERLGNAVCKHDAGIDDLDETAELILPHWLDQTDWARSGFTATRDGEIVGVAWLQTAAVGGESVDFDVWPDPELWGQGIEEALLKAIEDEARRLGRSIVQTFTIHRADAPGPRLTPATGAGSIPAGDRQTRFQLDHGYTLEQVERNSAFDLHGPFDEVERMLAASLDAAGAEYRLVQWTSPTPDHLVEGFAFALSRLDLDAPSGDLVVDEQQWDAARVRRRDARLAAQGLTVSVSAIEHVPSGRLVAYSELALPSDDPTAVTHQLGTLVVSDHRGHRLGLIVKCANLLRWRGIAPSSPRVTTFNAEENAHMLAINVAIGFRPVSYAAGWKKVLAG